MKDYTIRFVLNRKNESGFKEKKEGVKCKEDRLLQIEVKKDGTDKYVYISTNIRIRPDQYDSKMGFYL